MEDEHRELLRFFFRKWSTVELDNDAKALLTEDVLHVQTLLEIDEVSTEILHGAQYAPNRQWFAKRYQEL